MRIAALDLGSNSFHLVVVEAHGGGRFDTLVKEKEMLRLGDDVGRHGRISDERANAAVESVCRLVAIARSAGAERIVVKATAALREAENGPSLVDRFESEAGVQVEVISGSREAHLVFSAVRAAVALEPAPALCMDLGGGSLELTVGDQGGLRWAGSLRLGVGRLTAELVRDDPLSKGDVARLRERIGKCFEPHAARLASLAPQSLVGSSGTLLGLARMAAARTKGSDVPSLNQLTVSRKDLDAVHAELMDLPAEKRARMPGLDAKRADLIPAGSVLLQEVMDRFGFEELTVSEWALREGMILEVLAAADPLEWISDPKALREGAVLGLAERFSYQAEHAATVQRLALAVFDQTVDLHGLEPADRELLAHAALLHDVGEHVAMEDHDRHGAYLVMNGKLRGFSPQEVAMLASMCRFHRRGSPHKAGFAPFDGLPEDARSRTTALVAILRVADALDRSHSGSVERVEVEVAKDVVRLELYAPDGAEVEVWGLNRKGGLMEDVLGRRLEVAEKSP